MATKQLFLFADSKDYTSLISEIESSLTVRYTQTGMFDNEDPQYIESLLLVNPGIAESGDWNHCKSYLCLESNDFVSPRGVAQRTGGIKYFIDQKLNPRTVVIRLGGIFGNGILVASSIGTISSDPFSVSCFNIISKIVKKKFVKIGNFYVGESSKILMENGWRLVTNDKSPTEYDLK